MRKLSLIFVLLLILSACSTPVTPVTPISTVPPTEASASSTPEAMPCTVVHAPGTQTPGLESSLQPGDHTSGPADAPVTILVYSDFQCPSCAFLAGNLKLMRQLHPNSVRFVFRHFPLSEHDKATAAIRAVEAADMQGRFWEMHDLLFEKQAEWSPLPPEDFEGWISQQAPGLGLDATQFTADFQGETVEARTDQAIQFASGSQQASLPVLFINSNLPYTGRVDIVGLEQVVRLTLLAQSQFSACPPMVVEPLKQYLATLHTAKGDIIVELYPDKAPLAVNNFVFLARQGWYDGITFYRVAPGSVAQTGDPSETGLGNAGYFFTVEISPGLKFDRAGMVAMMNSGPATNSSLFFITEAATPQFDGLYTIFGRVISGLDVLSSLSARDPLPGTVPPPGDMLTSITIVEK